VNVVAEQDVVLEGRRIIDEAEKRGITLRLLGGVAFKVRCKSLESRNLSRRIADIDVAGLRRQKKAIEKLFVDFGYSPGFNAMMWERLIFYDKQNNRKVDVFLDTFQMSHKIPLRGRLELDDATLPLADLLMTKLQVYEATEREYKDVYALLEDYSLSTEDSKNAINGKYIAKLCSADWGLYRTSILNLERLEAYLSTFLEPDEQKIVKSKIEELRKLLNQEPKTFEWKLRSLLGDRVKWYDLPEERPSQL
jgi:hypothetical protein